MSADLNTRLEQAIKKRDTISSEVQKLKGKLEAAKTNLSTLEGECRAKNLDPDNLEAVLAALNTKYEALVTELETKLGEADGKLQAYTSKVQG